LANTAWRRTDPVALACEGNPSTPVDRWVIVSDEPCEVSHDVYWLGWNEDLSGLKNWLASGTEPVAVGLAIFPDVASAEASIASERLVAFAKQRLELDKLSQAAGPVAVIVRGLNPFEIAAADDLIARLTTELKAGGPDDGRRETRLISIAKTPVDRRLLGRLLNELRRGRSRHVVLEQDRRWTREIRLATDAANSTACTSPAYVLCGEVGLLAAEIANRLEQLHPGCRLAVAGDPLPEFLDVLDDQIDLEPFAPLGESFTTVLHVSSEGEVNEDATWQLINSNTTNVRVVSIQKRKSGELPVIDPVSIEADLKIDCLTTSPDAADPSMVSAHANAIVEIITSSAGQSKAVWLLGEVNALHTEAMFWAGSQPVEQATTATNTSEPVEEAWLSTQMQAARRDQRQPLLLNHFLDLLARVTNQERSRIRPQDPIRRLGLDSLMTIELKNAIESNLGITLDLTVLFQDPSIEQLVAHALQAWERLQQTATVPSMTTKSQTPVAAGGRP
jgi:acyl carrier protein